MKKEELYDFINYIEPFIISGKVKDGRITELNLNCSNQICSTPVDFFPEWKVEEGKVILEFTPKWIDEDGEKKLKL